MPPASLASLRQKTMHRWPGRPLRHPAIRLPAGKERSLDMERITPSAPRRRTRLAAIVTMTLLAAASIAAQQGATNGEWRAWGGDLGMTRYAPLDQINASNFNKLEEAWRFKTDNL